MRKADHLFKVTVREIRDTVYTVLAKDARRARESYKDGRKVGSRETSVVRATGYTKRG
jgi:hypothetical protein